MLVDAVSEVAEVGDVADSGYAAGGDSEVGRSEAAS